MSAADGFPIEWSVGDKTVLEENGFSKDLFNALSGEEHINKPILIFFPRQEPEHRIDRTQKTYH